MPGLEDEFGDVVKKARSGLGLPPAELAARVGMSEEDLRRVEAYTLRPDEATVRRLAEALALRPDPLWALAQDTWSPPAPPWQIGERYTIECLTNSYPEHCYVVADRAGDCLIVDPGEEPERVVRAATQHGRRPVAILITHEHRDHTGAVVPYVLEADGETAAFCGDTLFAGSAGNARFGYRALLASLRDKLARLPPRAVLYPGHGPATTVANELDRNPFL